MVLLHKANKIPIFAVFQNLNTQIFVCYAIKQDPGIIGI